MSTEFQYIVESAKWPGFTLEIPQTNIKSEIQLRNSPLYVLLTFEKFL